jgi:hypothetical protein
LPSCGGGQPSGYKGARIAKRYFASYWRWPWYFRLGHNRELFLPHFESRRVVRELWSDGSFPLRHTGKPFQRIRCSVLNAIIGLVEFANRLEDLVAKFETILPRI